MGKVEINLDDQSIKGLLLYLLLTKSYKEGQGDLLLVIQT